MSHRFTRRGLIGTVGVVGAVAAVPVMGTRSGALPSSSGALVTLGTPVRVFDSRALVPPGNGARIVAGESVGVPIGAAIDGGPALAAFVNLTVTETEGSGYLVVRGSVVREGVPLPPTSNINWWASGLTLANLVLTTVGAENFIEVHCSVGATHFIVDLFGWVSA